MSKLTRFMFFIGGLFGTIALLRWLDLRREAATSTRPLSDDVVKSLAPNILTIPIQETQVTPELRKPMRRITLLPFPIDKAWSRSVVQALLGMQPIPKVIGVTIEKSQAKETSVRLYTPSVRRSNAALLWIHGGGLIIGRAVQDDRLCAQVARELGILVVSVEYRMAPEHPFPSALDDCSAGWHWMQQEAIRLGIDPHRIAVGGESAGGGLAASLVQSLYDANEVMPVAQWLFCPMLDDSTATKRQLDDIKHFVWNNSLNRFGWQSYLGVEPGSDIVPRYAVPSRREDLHGLPPTWIGVGNIDLFYQEDRVYAERLQGDGVNVTLDVVPMAPHGFEAWAFDTAIVRDYLGRAQGWLQKELNGIHA